MKFILLILLVLLLAVSFGNAQINLVTNPSIEIIDSCPGYWGGGDIQLAFGWDTLRNGDGSTPDIFNSCYTHTNKRYFIPTNYWGFQYPKSGSGYAGISAISPGNGYREYIQGILTQKLIEGKNYCVKMYVSLTNRSEYSSVSLGLYLDDGQVHANIYNNYQLPNVTPQILNTIQQLDDTLNWIKIEGSFIADGTEEYITIGNFFPDNLSGIVHSYPSTSIPSSTFKGAYYYIDDVSVIDISTPAYAGNDTVIHPGGSVFIGRQPEVGLNEACVWFVNGTPIDTVAGLWVTPDTTTTYILQQTLCGNVSYDTVTVTMDFEVGISPQTTDSRPQVRLFPNPATDELKIQSPKHEIQNIALYDVTGRKVPLAGSLERERRGQGDDITLDINNLPQGLYFLQITLTNGTTESIKFMKQ